MESSTHFVMMGRVTPQYIETEISGITTSRSIDSIEIVTSPVDQAINRVTKDFNNIGLMSFDGIFTPYYVDLQGGAHSYLPSWSLKTSSGVNNKALNPFNPDNKFYESGVFKHTAFFNSGHNIGLSNRLEAVGVGTSGDLNTYKEMMFSNDVDYRRHRGIGLRSPLILSGWGYDVDSKPVPYVTDSSGNRSFHPDTFRKPSLWKSGPLDVRWDESRGVWAANGGTTTTDTGSCCECTCIQYGDMSVDGKRTTSQWSVKLETVREQQTNGYLILGGGTFTLSYSSGIDAWTTSLSSGDITAINLSGSGVNDLVPDRSGTLTFRRNDNGYTTLTLNMIGTIP